MPTWEETKRAGQTAFISRGNGFQDIHGSISDMYRQILSTGHIYPSTGAESLTRQIAEENIESIRFITGDKLDDILSTYKSGYLPMPTLQNNVKEHL
jgi:hypothetical protein